MTRKGWQICHPFDVVHDVSSEGITVVLDDEARAPALVFWSPRIAQGAWLCVVARDAASFVSRVATAVVCLAFSAHLPLLSLCAGGFKYLEFALEVPASLAGRRIRPVFKS